MNHHVVIVYKDQMIVRVASIDLEMEQAVDYEQAVITDRSDDVSTQKYYNLWSQKVSGGQFIPFCILASVILGILLPQNKFSHRRWTCSLIGTP